MNHYNFSENGLVMIEQGANDVEVEHMKPCQELWQLHADFEAD